MSPTLKRGLHWVGSALAIVGVTFVALRLQDYSSEIDFSEFGWAKWSAVGGMALVYGASNLLLAMAWWNLLKQFDASTSRSWAIKAYGVSQIAKYIPGNIFHLAGRQTIGLAAGLPGWPLAKSAIWELGLISVTGGLFGLLALPLLVAGLPVTASAWMFVLVMCLAAVLLWRFTGLAAARAFGWYAGFLAISGLLFVGLIELLAETHGTEVGHWLPLGGAYVLAWLVGLVTPGAPAGVGVRELVLLFVLKGVVPEADLLLAVVMGRVVTIFGDALYFLNTSIFTENKCIYKNDA